MNIIHQITLSELNDLSNKVIDIKASLESNQKLIITLDTETTGKYYNKFQIENTSIDIVDKIIEFGAIFSIENIDNFGFKTIIPILDEDNKDLGFRIFVNPFIDNHKPFHLSIPEEAFNVHNISLGFLEGKEIMECSDEQLFEPAPSLLQNYIVDDSYSTSYIKLIMKMINTSNKLVAHNSNFDVGMINEAVNDYNKLNEYDKLNYCGCEILDTLALFKDVFPKEKLIAIQKENPPIEINHKLDYLMYLAGIEKRSVHGAYWDSKLLIDSYAILLDKYLKSDYMKNIVEKQTTYLSKMNLTYLNNEFIFSLDTKIESYFFEKLYDETFLDFDTIKTHLTLQLSNINKQKRNIITDDQIDLSIVYYKVFINNNKDINTISKFKEKVEKMSTKAFVKLLPDIKKSKAFSQEEINNLIALNSESELFMSHYLTQAIFYYFENKLEEEVIIPKVKDEFKKLNELSLFANNKEINISKNQMYNYFRTDGSIATKDNNLTTIVGSISNIKKYFKEEIAKGNNKVICMDFNSIVNYIKVEKYVKAFNEESETKIEMNYGLTTLLKINIEDIKNSSNTDLSFLPNEIDFEINIIANNNNGIRLFPQILAKSYSDKYENEDSYKDPYITLEYFTELNNNKDLTITLGSYKGLIEKVLFESPNFWNKNIFILSILNQIKLTNDSINIEMYNSDVFLYDYKLNLLKDFENINYIYTNPNLYLKGDYDLHEVRCNKYNDKIYKLNNLDVFNNFKTIDKQNNNFITLDLEVCSKFPQDKVNIPGLIEDLNFIKRKRPNLYIELENILDEDGNKFDLNNNEKENVLKIQQRYFTLKAREHLIKRFETNNITEDVQPYYNKRFEFELDVINKMKFDGYTLLVDDFLRTLTCVIGGLIGPGRGCLTKEALVYTYNNDLLETKQINEIIIGDKVITHNNLIKEVTETFIYDIEEDLIEIETFHSDKLNPIILTKDHKIYCGNNEWKQAQEITTKDYLYLPIPKYKEIKINSWDMTLFSNFTKEKNYIIEDEFLIYKYSQNIINNFSVKDISNELKMSKETISKFKKYLNKEKTNITEKTITKISNYILTNFSSLNDWLIYVEKLNTKKIKKELMNSFYFRKFLGRWIGDGCIRSNLNRECVNLVFNKNDYVGIEETLEFIKENNYKYSLSFKKSICSIDILDSYLHSFIKTIFNDYKFESNSKYFPNFIFNLPKNDIKDIIDGYVAADGCIDKHTNRIKTGTVSKRLAYELKTLLLQIGVPSTIAIINRKENNHPIKLKDGNKEYRNEFPAIKTLHNVPLCNKNIYEIEDNKYIKLRVRKINNKIKVKTKVYDFTVEDDHSYTTTNFIVHNSAAGSLVSWAYGVTNVDPMLDYLNQGKHLLFERYLNPERVSLPDIDMDMNGLVNKDFLLTKLKEEYLNDETIDTFINIIENKYKDEDLLDGKGLIEDYQISLYGVDKVAKIVTRGTYQAKSAIAVVCEFLGNDFAEDVGFKLKGTPYIELTSRICGNAFTKPGVGFNEVLDETSKFFNPYFVNLYNSNANIKKVVDLARKLEGSISNYGVHAAGVLILDPKNNYLNNGYMIIGGVHVSVLDGKFVEDYINIKFDFLGLASLEEIDKTLQFIEKTNNKDIRDSIHYTINNEYILYNDEETYKKVFDIQNTKKIFQFSSDGMQDLVKRVEPKVFEDLVAITALYRPGPMESGMVDMYVRNKRNPELIFYPFKELEIALEPTYGTCLVGNTLITTKDGKNIKIKDIVDNNMVGLYVLSLNEKTNKLEYKKITKTFNNGKKDTFKITTKNGYAIEATKEHKFFTNRGWIKLKDLTKDDFLALPKKHIEIENNEISINNNNNDIYFTKIKNIEIHKTKTEVYDIEVEDNHNFFGNNILVHNCVYQEQVMKIVQVLGGFSLGGADLVRRAMGKKIKEELDKLKGQFIEGTIETYKDRYLNIDTIQQMARINEQIIYIDETNNISLKSIKEMNDLNVFKSDFSTVDYGQVFIKDNKKLELEETYITRFLADSLFEDIIKFAGYGFNKSHAYAYTNVSMQMAYLKAHYPLEFFASILVNNSDDVEKLSEYIIDSKKNNIKLLGVDINKSNLTFDIIDDYIIYGLSNIKGVSNKDIKKILQDRDINGEFKSFEDFLNRFICNHNGSYKTIENLIYAGAFDKLDLSIKDMQKFLFFNNLNTLSVTEEKDIYSERLKSKATYLKSLVNSNNKSLFDMDEIPLNDKLINMFNLENDKHLLPLLITKLLNTKDSTNVKMFTSKTENSKLKLINELKEHYGYIESVKKNIDNTLDLSLVENKRTFLFKLIDLINNDSKLDDSKVIESIYKNYDKNKSLINLSNIEFENTGSLSNFGSLLNRHYIFSEYEDVEVLNLLKDQFKQEGLFRFRAIVRDVISGKNDKDEVYMTILVIDENEIEQRFYLTQDQIFRYKNNISSGDPIILEIEIKEQKEKFYKKLLSIDVLKESKQWTSDTGFNLPLLSIKDLDQDKIKKNESLKVEFCTLEDIKEDWLISNNNWPGIDEGNKQVVLILIDYKQITTKEGKIYQIITVTDGIGNTSIELLYSNLNLIELDNNKRKPIMIELGKRSNNGYGLGAAYKSEIVYLGDKYIKSDDEENKKSIVRKTTFNEILDGKEHINVYSKGKTLLGRQLSNLADIPTVLMLDNETINFYTVEGCWYFLKIYLSLNIKDYELTKMNGYEAKSYGMEKTRSLSPLVDENKAFFQSKIKEVVKYKILNNENLLNEFINNELPYVHYYNYSGNIKNLPETIWLMDFLNNLKDNINK